MSLTAKMRQLLLFIADYQSRNDGKTPSYEVARHALGFGSKSRIFHLVKALIERGYVVKNGRNLEILRLMPAEPKLVPVNVQPKSPKTPMSKVNMLIATMRDQIDNARPMCAHGEPVKNLPELWTWGKRA